LSRCCVLHLHIEHSSPAQVRATWRSICRRNGPVRHRIAASRRPASEQVNRLSDDFARACVLNSERSPLLARINTYLVRWIRNTYRRLDATRAAHRKLAELAAGQPRLFRHWPGSPAPGDEDDKSPVTGDCHAGICGSRGLAMPPATRPWDLIGSGIRHLRGSPAVSPIAWDSSDTLGRRTDAAGEWVSTPASCTP